MQRLERGENISWHFGYNGLRHPGTFQDCQEGMCRRARWWLHRRKDRSK